MGELAGEGILFLLQLHPLIRTFCSMSCLLVVYDICSRMPSRAGGADGLAEGGPRLRRVPQHHQREGRLNPVEDSTSKVQRQIMQRKEAKMKHVAHTRRVIEGLSYIDRIAQQVAKGDMQVIKSDLVHFLRFLNWKRLRLQKHGETLRQKRNI